MVNLDSFKNLDIIIMCGLHGSGKTHFAKAYLKENNRKRVNRRELRKSLYNMISFGEKWEERFFDEADENLVKHVEKRIIEHCLHHKLKILIDNTNVTKASRKKYVVLANNLNRSIGVIYLNTPVEKCLERNRKSENSMPEIVITKHFAMKELPEAGEGFDEKLVIDLY